MWTTRWLKKRVIGWGRLPNGNGEGVALRQRGNGERGTINNKQLITHVSHFFIPLGTTYR